MKRVFNIINRAINLGYDVDLQDALIDILGEAEAIILEADVDYISVCDASRHYDHISWSDGKGFTYEADGQYLSSDDSRNHYYRYQDGQYHEVPWYDHTEDDFVAMEHVVDTDGKHVLLIAK